MAHMDTFFPASETLDFKEEDNRFFCPGVTDDTANLAEQNLILVIFFEDFYK